MRFLTDLLFNSSDSYLVAWRLSIVGIVASVLAFAFFPAAFGIVLLASAFVILQSWAWYYSDWVDNALHFERSEVSKRRAFFIHLRLAVAGMVAIMVIAKIITTAVGTTPNAAGYAIWVLTIPTYFVSQTVQQFVIGCLRELCNAPFNLTIIFLGLTTNPGFHDAKMANIIPFAQRLFSAITGDTSKLTFLHETDEIMRKLPGYR